MMLLRVGCVIALTAHLTQAPPLQYDSCLRVPARTCEPVRSRFCCMHLFTQPISFASLSPRAFEPGLPLLFLCPPPPHSSAQTFSGARAREHALHGPRWIQTPGDSVPSERTRPHTPPLPLSLLTPPPPPFIRAHLLDLDSDSRLV